MKNYLFVLLAGLSLTFVACKNDSSSASDTAVSPATTTPTTTMTEGDMTTAVPSGPTTSIQFDESEFDFGTVAEGEKVTHVYKFKNTGNEPLVISNAKGSCGCTVPEWPKEPIAPGDGGEIRVQFDSAGKGTPEGSPQTKRVTITANTDPVDTYLNIKGIVSKPAQ